MARKTKITHCELTVLPDPPKTPPTPAQNNATFTYKSPPLKVSELEHIRARIVKFQSFLNAIDTAIQNAVNVIPEKKLAHYRLELDLMRRIGQDVFDYYMINTIKRTGIKLGEDYKRHLEYVVLQEIDKLIVRTKEAEIETNIKCMARLYDLRFQQISVGKLPKCYICHGKTEDGTPFHTEQGETVVLCKHCLKEYQRWGEMPSSEEYINEEIVYPEGYCAEDSMPKVVFMEIDDSEDLKKKEEEYRRCHKKRKGKQ